MPTPLTDAINALTRYANETTGASDTTLSDAVATLVEGYGQGGGSDRWVTIIDNSFDTYTNYKASDGVTFTVMDGGEWVQVTQNGENKNSSSLYNNPRFLYSIIKNKNCRITWNIECSDPSITNTTVANAALSLGLFTNQVQTSGTAASASRKAKYDIASSALGNILGSHSIEFVPNDLFANLTQADYFGWNFGFRSSISSLTWSILKLKFEVYDLYG